MDNRTGATPPPTNESVERVRGAAEEAFGEVKHAVKDATGAIKDRAKETVESAQAKAADQARTAANTLRDTADRLEGDLPWLDTSLRKAADGLEGLTSGLNKGNLKQTMDGVCDFARRQPAVFLGLSVALGFALARVGKTAIEEAQENRTANSDGDNMYQEAVAPYAPAGEV
jgi:hypothetical protein